MDDVNINIDGLVLHAGHSLSAQVRERLATALPSADLDSVSRAVGEAVQRQVDRAGPVLPG